MFSSMGCFLNTFFAAENAPVLSAPLDDDESSLLGCRTMTLGRSAITTEGGGPMRIDARASIS